MRIGDGMGYAKRKVAMIVVVLAVLIAPVAAAGATSLWADVPDDSIFVNDTNWMKVTGVSIGCNPPANTNYCPKDFLTREQMAAFMHRLSDAQVVNAATAIDAENAENADAVDGRDANELMSITGSDSGSLKGFSPQPPASNAVLLATLTGFEVPISGGVITALGNAQADVVSGTQAGLVWIDIDGGGTCTSPIPDAAGTGAYLVGEGETLLETTSAIRTEQVAAGTHRIDLCAAAFGTPLSASTDIISHLNATWTPIASGAGVSSGGESTTWQEILAPYAELFAANG